MILLIAIFFIFDRLLKALALKTISAQPIKLIGDFLFFNFTKNFNIAFSLPLSGLVLNIILLTIITALIYYIFYLILNKKSEKLNIVLLTFILFGAISNILDRLSFGFVIDYIELKYFTVFNLADIMISLGSLVLILKNIRHKQ